VSSPALKPAMDSLSVGPKGQRSPASYYRLNVCCKWSPSYVIFSLLKRRTVSSHFFTGTRGSRPFSLSLSKLLQHHQLTMAPYLTGNHGFWYCTCGRLLGKSLRTIGYIQDTWELGKYDENPITHVYFSPKKTQGVAPRPKPVRVLLPLCC
jgi:hypothetical protein